MMGLNVGRVANLRPIANRPSDGTQDASTILEHTFVALSTVREGVRRPIGNRPHSRKSADIRLVFAMVATFIPYFCAPGAHHQQVGNPPHNGV